MLPRGIQIRMFLDLLDPDPLVRGTDPNPLVRGTDLHLRIRTKMSQIHNTDILNGRSRKDYPGPDSKLLIGKGN